MKNGNLLIKLEQDKGFDDYYKAKSVSIVPSHLGSCNLSPSKRLMNDVIEQIGGFYNNSIYYTDTDSLYIHKKKWSDLIDDGFVGKSLGLCKNDYRQSGIF